MSRRNKKPRMHYTIENHHLWWDRKLKKWTKDLSDGHSFCNHRIFKTASKAFRHFRTLPSGSVLTRFVPSKGGWKVQDFERR